MIPSIFFERRWCLIGALVLLIIWSLGFLWPSERRLEQDRSLLATLTQSMRLREQETRELSTLRRTYSDLVLRRRRAGLDGVPAEVMQRVITGLARSADQHHVRIVSMLADGSRGDAAATYQTTVVGTYPAIINWALNVNDGRYPLVASLRQLTLQSANAPESHVLTGTFLIRSFAKGTTLHGSLSRE
jgi:hypothetical protein